MNLAELNASLNRQKGGFDRWAHSRLNAVESVRQKHEVELRKATSEYEELKSCEEKLQQEVEGLDSSINQENKEAEDLLQKVSRLGERGPPTRPVPPRAVLFHSSAEEGARPLSALSLRPTAH